MVRVIISISSQFNLSILREFVIFWIYRTRSRFEIRFIQIVNIRGNSVQYRYDIKEWNYRVSFIYIYIYSDSPCISIDKNIIYFFQSSSNFIGNDQEGENEVFEAEKKKKFEKRFPRNWSGQMMSVNPRFSLHNRHSIRPMSSIIDRFH